MRQRFARTSLSPLFPVAACLLAACATSSPDLGDKEGSALSAATCAKASPWATGVPYARGEEVLFGGELYECLQSHTSEDGWTPAAVPALWSPLGSCSSTGTTDAGGGGSSGGATGGVATGSGGGTCATAAAWAPYVAYTRGEDASDSNVVYTCLQSHTSLPGWNPAATPALWSPTGCGTTSGSGSSGGSKADAGASGGTGSAGGGGASSPPDAGSSSGGSSSGSSGGGATTGTAPAGLIFSPYKDTSINMNWNTNLIQTNVSGAPASLASDLAAHGGKAITLAFATGECGSESWGGVAGTAMAAANVGPLSSAGVNYILSTGGAAGSFTCGTDSGMETFISSWASPHLIGIDFDIEAGQSQDVINNLVARIKAAHSAHPALRFSLTLATLAPNNGSSTAASLGSGAQDSFNVYGDNAMSAVASTLGYTKGTASSWPSYLTIDLMVMDYGSASDGVCVVSGGACEMGQSAIQAAYNLHDKWGVPYSNIELTPMIGGNDVSGELFTLADADTVAKFAISQGLGGVHYWSYDRDIDCPAGSASATCNSYGSAGAYGFLKRFQSDGL